MSRGHISQPFDGAGLVEGFFASTLSKTEMVAFVEAILTADDFYESCWDEFEALFRRVVWRFPDDWLVTYGPREGTFVQHLTEKWDGGSEAKNQVLSAVAAFGGTADFEDAVNGFTLQVNGGMLGPAEIVAVVDALTTAHGVPTLELPWFDRAERISDDVEEILDDEDLDEAARRSYEVFARLYSTKLRPTSPWKIAMTDSDDLLPHHSAYGRFYQLMDELEERNWIVINGECCGTCAGSSIREARADDPSKANSPTFVVFEQNAESTWGISGWVRILQSRGEGFEELAEAIASVGLRIEADSDSLFVITA